MPKEILTEEQSAEVAQLITEGISQIEKLPAFIALRDKITKHVNDNMTNIGKRLEAMEKVIDILEDDVRAVGGKSKPEPVKENKKTFPITMLEW